jgi:hypothetical protein
MNSVGKPDAAVERAGGDEARDETLAGTLKKH